MTRDLAFVEKLAREAGGLLMGHYGRLQGVDKKSARDLVTAADREAEAFIIKTLRQTFGEESILAEESLSKASMTPDIWIVDPLDGTTNFVHKIPHFAVSIAWYQEGKPCLACVFNPLLEECFTAEAGGGARKNGEPLHASQTSALTEAVLATGFAYEREKKADSNLQHFVDLSYRCRGLRRLGSAALDLCRVAEGSFDGFWELHLQPWDVAAGALVALEAGALVTDFSGGPDWLHGGQIVAAPPLLAEPIREILRSADPARLRGPSKSADPDL